MTAGPVTGRVRIGVSGWRYARWRATSTPRPATAPRAQYIGEQFPSVELNGSFYSLQRPESYRTWASSVPDDFVFAVKGSRYVTHMLRLRAVDQALANFFASGVLALGERLGPILWQLPERQKFVPALLESFLDTLPAPPGRRSNSPAATTNASVTARGSTSTPTGRCATRSNRAPPPSPTPRA